MTDPFRRLPGSRRTPPGAERRILRRLPKVLVGGSLLIVLPSLLWRLAGSSDAGSGAATATMNIDIWVAAVLGLHWTLVLTVAIGAFIVMVMKGPAYVADAYPLPEEREPGQPPRPR